MIERYEEEGGVISNFVLFLTGAAAGVITGLLVAPRSGEETRYELGNWFRDKKDRGMGLVSNIRGRAMGSIEEGTERFGRRRHSRSY